MGWGRTLLLGDIGNRLDIEDVERDVAEIKRLISSGSPRDMSQDQKIAGLAEDLAQMKLVLVALIRLLINKGNLTKQEIELIVAAIDAEDGRSDGKFHGKIV